MLHLLTSRYRLLAGLAALLLVGAVAVTAVAIPDEIRTHLDVECFPLSDCDNDACYFPNNPCNHCSNSLSRSICCYPAPEVTCLQLTDQDGCGTHINGICDENLVCITTQTSEVCVRLVCNDDGTTP